MRTKQQDRESCQKKIAYASRQEAEAAGDRARRIGKSILAYRCTVCGCWHMTKALNKDPSDGRSTTTHRR